MSNVDCPAPRAGIVDCLDCQQTQHVNSDRLPRLPYLSFQGSPNIAWTARHCISTALHQRAQGTSALLPVPLLCGSESADVAAASGRSCWALAPLAYKEVSVGAGAAADGASVPILRAQTPAPDG